MSGREGLQGVARNNAHFLDQFTSLGAAAAVTSRIRLGTAVCVVAQHDPILLARRVATTDYLSGGRFCLALEPVGSLSRCVITASNSVCGGA